MYNVKTKQATSKSFLDHCPYQVIGLTAEQAETFTLPDNWRNLARTFTVFYSLESAQEAAEKRTLLNDEQPFAVVDRDNGTIALIAEGYKTMSWL